MIKNCTKKDVQQWLGKDIASGQICDLFNQFEFKTVFLNDYQEAHFYCNGIKYQSLFKKEDGIKTLVDDKIPHILLEEIIDSKNDELNEILKENGYSSTLKLSDFNNFLFKTYHNSPVLNSMEFDDETRTKIDYTFLINKPIRLGFYTTVEIFKRFHFHPMPSLSCDDLKRIMSFKFLDINDLYIAKIPKIRELNDGELLKNLFELEQTPSRKVIDFIKSYQGYDMLSCYCSPKSLIDYLSQIQDFPKSVDELRYTMETINFVDNYSIPNCLEKPYITSSDNHYHYIDFDLVKDFIDTLYDVYPDYFKQNNKIKYIDLLDDTRKIFYDRDFVFKNVVGSVLESVGHNGFSILDMFPFEPKDRLEIKPLVNLNDLSREIVGTNGNLSEHYYNVLKGTHFWFSLNNTYTNQKSALEIKFDQNKNTFVIEQNVGGGYFYNDEDAFVSFEHTDERFSHEDAEYVLNQIQKHVDNRVYQIFVEKACLQPEEINHIKERVKDPETYKKALKDKLKTFKQLSEYEERNIKYKP